MTTRISKHALRIASVAWIAPLLIVAAGCGGVRSFSAVPPALELEPAQSVAANGDEVVAQVGAYYSAEPDIAAIAGSLANALERSPRDAALNEVAAQLAVLNEDQAGAWRHWLTAATDLSSPLTHIYLDRALASDITTEQSNATVRVLQALQAHHPSEALRLDAGVRLIRLLELRGELEKAEEVSASLPFIQDFLMVGPSTTIKGAVFMPLTLRRRLYSAKAKWTWKRRCAVFSCRCNGAAPKSTIAWAAFASEKSSLPIAGSQPTCFRLFPAM